jgi:hypothetical protein
LIVSQIMRVAATRIPAPAAPRARADDGAAPRSDGAGPISGSDQAERSGLVTITIIGDQPEVAGAEEDVGGGLDAEQLVPGRVRRTEQGEGGQRDDRHAVAERHRRAAAAAGADLPADVHSTHAAVAAKPRTPRARA